MMLSDFPLTPSPDAPRPSATGHIQLNAQLNTAPSPAPAPLRAANENSELHLTPCPAALALAAVTSSAQPAAASAALAPTALTSSALPAAASTAVAPTAATSAAVAPTTARAAGPRHMDLHALKTNRDPLIERLFGPEVSAAFAEPNITEIMLNESGELLVEHKDSGMWHIGTMAPQAAQNAMRALATLLGQDLDRACPILSGDITVHHARFEGLLPPLVSAPVFAIRRHADCSHTLADLEALGSLSASQTKMLQQALKAHLSILVSGATGTGKTTLVDTLLNELITHSPYERVVTIEDTKELSALPGNFVHLVGNGKVELSTLLRSALRLRPDRIVVGEVRGPEALDLVDALTTGHRGGLATVHAGTPQQALQRLTLLVSRNPSCPRQIEPMVASAIDLVVQTERSGLTRHITDIALCAGYHNGHFALIPVTTTLDAALNLRRAHENRTA